METNYELKHKCLLVPLKVVLLVLAMVLVGFSTYAQGSKSLKVADDRGLIEAMDNPSVGTILLSPGHYVYLNIDAKEGTQVIKSQASSGNRSSSGCTYWIKGDNFCYQPNGTVYDNEGNPHYGWAYGQTTCGTINTTCLSWPVPCCPAENTGYWICTEKPAGASNPIFWAPADYIMDFLVDKPGKYKFKHVWDPAVYPAFTEYAEVETEYNFYGPLVFDFSAPDVCGTTTYIDFSFTEGFDPQNSHVIQWYIDDYPYGNPVPVSGPQQTVVDYPFSVPECGPWQIIAIYNPGEDCFTEVWDLVDFACQPVADAGPDINVCDETCWYSLVGSTGLYSYSPSHFWQWIQIDGPNDLVFDDPTELVTGVCVENPVEDCPYGEYQVQFQVGNGLCYDEDEAYLRFYEAPVAEAGPDQHICNTFSFSLAAVPYVYCGDEGVNYWSTSYWEVVSKADPAATITFSPSAFDPNAVVSIISSATCPFGEYSFKWVEINSKGEDLGGCEDEDIVVVTIYEDPAPSAGEDMVFCDSFAFTLYGIGDEPCYDNTVVRYNWDKSSQPGDCEVLFYFDNEEQPSVEIANCAEGTCPYGKYTFTFTQENGYLDGNEQFHSVCSTSDDVDVWVFEEPIANAGPDQYICNDWAFSLAAVPTEFCGEAGTNYFTWGVWELVSGPAPVEFSDDNDPGAQVSVDWEASQCPYGTFTFKWTEYNGFGTPFQGCVDEDYVTVTIYEFPESLSAGDNQSFCEQFEFALDGAIDFPCTQQLAYSIYWEVVDQPGDCEVILNTPGSIDPGVTITNCDANCKYGEYVFRVTQTNGYWDRTTQQFIEVCSNSDEVSVWIFEQPENITAGEDLLLCNDYAFSLNATGSEYCGVYGVNYINSYNWELVNGPEGVECEVAISTPTAESTGVTISDCAGECPYGEWVFRFTEKNGNTQEWCEASDLVSVFIFEQPFADAGDDVAQCVDIALTYCFDMTANFDYCYSMYGVWSKSCGPGDVVFEDLTDPNTNICFQEPGHYEFNWHVWNAAQDCEADDAVVFDLIEQPTAQGTDDELIAPCDELCYSLADAGIIKYQYFGTDEGDCPNFEDHAHWTYVSGPTGNPAEVTFADDTDPATELCVSTFGCYTVRWNEINKQVDGELECTSYYDVFVQFVETPEPEAGEDASVCGPCYDMTATPYTANNCAEGQSESYWEFVSYLPPADPCPTDAFAVQYTPCFVEFDINDPNAQICVCDDCLGSHYGTYGFRWVNASGFCIGYDTVYIEFKQKPAELALEGMYNPSNCYDSECTNCEVNCLYPDGNTLDKGRLATPLSVCAGSSLNFGIDWDCFCFGGPIPGYTYEWSFIGPAGSYMQAEPYWYDCSAECWRGSDDVFICFGECCDTARLYLTITTPLGCTTTEEWKFFVEHKPCANIEGPEMAEVNAVDTYCNVCPEDYDMSCLLYTWTAEHCGVIQSGQGTECIDVLWTNYNANGGWGEITVTVFDTCTGCCNYDEMMVQMYPAGTLGDATLAGYVLYHNAGQTPLNGVDVQLWNGGIPVMTTTTFNDIEGGNGMGYFEFSGINGTTEFGVTTTNEHPWGNGNIPGANATDALAVQLYAIGSLPPTFDTCLVVKDAMNVNNSATINSTDALWIKQRAINMVGYFPAGNWATEPGLTANAGDSPLDILTLNMGDANRSIVPNSNKSMPAIDLVNDGTMNVVTGEVFNLPIRIEKADQFGAITLNLEYNPALIDVVDVVAVDGMLSNIGNGVVGIAWSNLNPMVLADNDVVVTLKVKAVGVISSTEKLFSIGMNSEFADPTANVIEPVTLKSFGVTTDPAALDYFLSTNRPNPFSTSTTIEYTMPETGKVKLSVLDMLGQELAVIVEATQTAGTYSVQFNAAGLATGVYLYKITVDGETRDFISTQRMVVSH
jgi:hypothetical protein